jgi:hypothetical protein
MEFRREPLGLAATLGEATDISTVKPCSARFSKVPNVMEQWNGANGFVFFARRGELASNRREDLEVGMLSLHLLQNCMVCGLLTVPDL